MYERPYDLVHGPGGYRVRIRARGNAVLASAMLNRGTAFSEPERRALGLTGLLPSGVTTLTSQLERVYAQYGRCTRRCGAPNTPASTSSESA